MCDVTREAFVRDAKGVVPYNGGSELRSAEMEFAKALRDENIRLKRAIAEREALDAVYFAEIEVCRGEVVFHEPA